MMISKPNDFTSHHQQTQSDATSEKSTSRFAIIGKGVKMGMGIAKEILSVPFDFFVRPERLNETMNSALSHLVPAQSLLIDDISLASEATSNRVLPHVTVPQTGNLGLNLFNKGVAHVGNMAINTAIIALGVVGAGLAVPAAIIGGTGVGVYKAGQAIQPMLSAAWNTTPGKIVLSILAALAVTAAIGAVVYFGILPLAATFGATAVALTAGGIINALALGLNLAMNYVNSRENAETRAKLEEHIASYKSVELRSIGQAANTTATDTDDEKLLVDSRKTTTTTTDTEN